MRSAFLFLALMLPAMSGAVPVDITLKPSFQTRHAYVTVDDVAEIRNATPEQEARIASHRMRLGPYTAGVWRLYRGRLARELRTIAADVTFNWLGSEFVEIAVATRLVAAETITATAVDYLREILVSHGREVELRVMKPPASTRIPEGDMVMVPRVATLDRRARECVHVDLWVDDIRVTSVPVWLDVDVPIEALVATIDVAPERSLSAGNVRLAKVNALGVRGTPVTVLAQLAGKRLRRHLSAGEVVRVEDLEAMPAVVRGQQVKVKVDGAGIALETAAVAAEDGVVGSKIRVDRVDMTASFHADVVGFGVVAVTND